MRVGALVSNKELGKGLVVQNNGSGWLVCWYERGAGGKHMKTIIYKTTTYPLHWACGGGFGPVAVLSIGAEKWQKD